MPGVTENTSIVGKSKPTNNKRKDKADLKEVNSESKNSRVKKSEISKDKKKKKKDKTKDASRKHRPSCSSLASSGTQLKPPFPNFLGGACLPPHFLQNNYQLIRHFPYPHSNNLYLAGMGGAQAVLPSSQNPVARQLPVGPGLSTTHGSSSGNFKIPGL